MSVEPKQISIFCGSSSNCPHKSNVVLEQYQFDPSDMKPIQNTLAESRRWVKKSIDEEKGDNIPLSVIKDLECTSSIILTNQMKCEDDRCMEQYHCMDAKTTESMSVLQKTMIKSKHICNHVNLPFVQMALEQNTVVISNDIENDARFKEEYKGPPYDHFGINNCMIVPLYAGTRNIIVGVVICANKIPSENQCCGFSVKDYLKSYHMFDSLGIYLVMKWTDNQLKRMEGMLHQEQVLHKEEVQKITLNKNSFIATMSHEIRTPLNAINGYNELLLTNGEKLPAQYLGWLRKQRDATLTLTQLIANILDYAKLKTYSVTLNSKPFSMKNCLEKARELCWQECQAKNIKLSTQIGKDIPKILLGDEMRFSQVIRNLISNSVKYTSHGFINVRIDCKRLDSGKLNIFVMVEDTGKGIPLHMQDQIFSEFAQVRDNISPSASIQGIGLGLAISREIVNLMGGTIGVESDGRSGSKFHFDVILRDNSDMENMLLEAKSNLKDGAVLIVDDQEVNRLLMTKLFFKWEMRPHTCSTVDEAVLMLESYPVDYFRIALVDIDLINESGVSLAQRIVGDKVYSKIALIAASSMGKNFLGKEYFDVIHTKPIKEEDLLEDICQILHQDYRIRSVPKITTVDGSVISLGRSNGYILIVDDDESSRIVCHELLQQLGYYLHETASNGLEALKMIENKKDHYSIILMDVLMPRINGIECTKRINSEPTRYGTPSIIALTADATDYTKGEILRAGAKDFISKPVTMSCLQKSLEEHYRGPISQRVGEMRTKPKKKKRRNYKRNK